MRLAEQKQKIREELLARRENIEETAYLEKSKRIIQRLTDMTEYKKAGFIHCYISMNERREVNTHSLIKKMLSEEKKVVVSITQIEKNTLRNVMLEEFSDLKLNRWGVLEPVGGKKTEADKLDLVIVPMAGGDLNKNRIGYGKGFYDRFLDSVTCPKIGLLLEACLLDELPIEAFDVPLDTLVTEARIVN